MPNPKYDDQFRKAECEGKKSWPSPQAVYSTLGSRRSVKIKKANVFHCKYCGGYHIGHMKRKRKGNGR